MPPHESKYLNKIKVKKNVLRCKEKLRVSRFKKYFTYYER
jgi:hypothetical protein